MIRLRALHLLYLIDLNVLIICYHRHILSIGAIISVKYTIKYTIHIVIVNLVGVSL